MGFRNMIPCGQNQKVSAPDSTNAEAPPPQAPVMNVVPAIMVSEFGSPEVLQMSSRELPELSKGQVLVAIKASGLNPSDTYTRLGPAGPYGGMPHLLPQLPYTPGKDGAGVIEEVGPEVTDFKVGDRVYTTMSVTGTCAAKAICDVSTIHPLPEAMSFAQGACIGVPAVTAYYALQFRGQVQPSEKVFVHGASGAVGLAAVQMAKKMVGPEGLVVGSAGTKEGEEAVKAAGADAVVNHRSEGCVDELKKVVPAGFDLILEMFAHVNLSKDLVLCNRRGRVCIIGSRSADINVNPRHFMACEADVRGVFLPKSSAEERAETHKALRAFMEEGVLKPVVSQEIPIQEAAKAHKEVMEPSAGGASGNIVIIP
mmetsp:Transcript_70898/g.148309  ORF Transcript_70898/g.148309 Transcript_70898/m.148309 type:complete len:369 (-) Transcript_70898:442-1548(-)|eukprot:CAMPEP_0206447442 /NCGR_PEP_ID=MMETSP0324_2-20121206/16807_1 /ASSEMBLY_ACC=CAM_ASM_000836 /TAXON_ID=2866 /ORGANISM="Crypthecodinium cohnii, Strain Seligo" /LENGTH=368 /DNA_ID=CAMNT_0053916251 /DNA_START=70 /DNA_END=1176 /DNA_ORIENTATION=+